MTGRRDFLIALGAALGWSLAVRAQLKAMPVIGYLDTFSPGFNTPYLAAFHEGLSDTGYIDGRNVTIEHRWAEGQSDRLPEMAADLVSRSVHVIVTNGGDVAARAVKNATTAIPIVFISGGDPIGSGLVASFARPEGNLTGVTFMTSELMGKRFDLLSEAVPQARTIALLVNPESLSTERIIRDVQEAAATKGVQLHVVRAGAAGEFESAFASLIEQKAGALVLGNDPFFNSRREQILALASAHAVPAIYEWREFAAAGGLMSYGSRLRDTHRKAGIYVGRILKGAKPADLPVEQASKFELVINLNTAKTLGLTVPQSLLARADEVIE